jgi:hypothetical protein
VTDLFEYRGGSDLLPLVVTLLIVNSDNLAATQFASVFVAAGVDSMSYSPQSASLPANGWPTLGSLIDAGTRLVTFLSTTASFDAAPYLIDGERLTPRPPLHAPNPVPSKNLVTFGRLHTILSTSPLSNARRTEAQAMFRPRCS